MNRCFTPIICRTFSTNTRGYVRHSHRYRKQRSVPRPSPIKPTPHLKSYVTKQDFKTTHHRPRTGSTGPTIPVLHDMFDDESVLLEWAKRAP